MATYYFRNVGTNWGDAANWSLTDGGGATGAVPTSADDAYFTSNSGNCTVNTSARVCKTLVFSGVGAGNYAGTLTMTYGITVSGNVTLSATMTIAGTGTLAVNVTGNLTSNGAIWSGSINFAGALQTYTLIDNWTITGNALFAGTSGITLNGAKLFVGGNLTMTTQISLGTATIELNGTGTWSGTAAVRTNLIINTGGTITINGTVAYDRNTLTYIAGTVRANTATLNVALNTTFINCDKINFKAITITAARTITLNKFFSGSAIQPTRIQSTSATSNYTIVFTDNFEKITKFTKISNCTVTNRGQLFCLTDNSNKGGNIGLRYINQSPNGLPKNIPSTPTQIAYGLGQVADPSFIVN